MSAPGIEISVFIPVFNESTYIDRLMQSLIGENENLADFYLLEGRSHDDTAARIKQWQARFPYVHLVDNPSRYVSFGFNKAFPDTDGKYIALLGAHAEYPPDYLRMAKAILDKNECDVVGGPLIQKGRTGKGAAIAYAMSSQIGVGNTAFRTSNARQFVDSVAFAVYKREVFDAVGLLDEQLIRNQDDELHYRINAAGFKILMEPTLQCVYYVRESFTNLFSQYFQYGLYKPLVLKKVMSGLRLRHLVPSLFVAYLVTLPVLIMTIGLIALVPVGAYGLLVGYASVVNDLPAKDKISAYFAFLILHVSYGVGFLIGIGKLFRKK